MRRLTFDAIGTRWVIETDAPLSRTLETSVRQCIKDFDATYSRFRDDSLVSDIAIRPGTFTFPKNCHALIAFYQELYDVTHGALTPLIGKALEESGYDKQYSFVPQPVHSIPKWQDVMQWEGTTVHTTRPVTLDFGAAGKGYLVDMIGELLEDSGVYAYTIDASGDIRQRGPKGERIGMENPYDASSVLGVMNIKNESLCASATNRRKWGNGLHHIIDARTVQPTQRVVATWVTHDSTMIADGLATALFFAEPVDLEKQWTFQYAVLKSDGKVTHSDSFMGELFI